MDEITLRENVSEEYDFVTVFKLQTKSCRQNNVRNINAVAKYSKTVE